MAGAVTDGGKSSGWSAGLDFIFREMLAQHAAPRQGDSEQGDRSDWHSMLCHYKDLGDCVAFGRFIGSVEGICGLLMGR
jgi:hypothetical protein